MTVFGDGILRRGVRDGGILARRDEAPREVFIYGVLSSVSPNEQVVKLDQNGNLIWSKTGLLPVGMRRCASDGENLYSAASDGTIVKINSDGEVVWTEKPTALSNDWFECAICVDPEGAVYFGNRTGRVYRIDPDGTLDWVNNSYTFRSDVRSITYDEKTHSVFWAAGRVGNGALRQVDATSGELIRQIFSDGSGICRAVAIDPDQGRVFATRSNSDIFCFDFNGNQIWHRTYANQPAFDGLAYRPTSLIVHFDPEGRVGRVDPDNGDLTWVTSPDPENPARGIDLDASNRIYTAGANSLNLYRQLSPDGLENWTYSSPNPNPSRSDIATTAGVYSAFG